MKLSDETLELILDELDDEELDITVQSAVDGMIDGDHHHRKVFRVGRALQLARRDVKQMFHGDDDDETSEVALPT